MLSLLLVGATDFRPRSPVQLCGLASRRATRSGPATAAVTRASYVTTRAAAATHTTRAHAGRSTDLTVGRASPGPDQGRGVSPAAPDSPPGRGQGNGAHESRRSPHNRDNNDDKEDVQIAYPNTEVSTHFGKYPISFTLYPKLAIFVPVICSTPSCLDFSPTTESRTAQRRQGPSSQANTHCPTRDREREDGAWIRRPGAPPHARSPTRT